MKTLLLLALAFAVSACAYSPDRRYGDDRYRYGKDHVGQNDGQNRVLVCHKGKKTMELPESALGGHLGHGDYRGRCR